MAKAKRIPGCHPERKHKARGLCESCYNASTASKEARKRYAMSAKGREAQERASIKHETTAAYKEYRKSYNNSLKRKEYLKSYNKSANGSVSRKKAKTRYNESEKGIEKIKRYNGSEVSKEKRKRYRKSEKGKQQKLLSLYGISLADWNRMFESQGGLCAIRGCGARIESTDHDHVTGKVRELLCHGCNMSRGLLREDARIMRGLADYAERHNAIPRPLPPTEDESQDEDIDVIQLSFLLNMAVS
jgi:Recombination endonuclease VII